MVLDVSRKARTRRTARAEALLRAAPDTLERLRRGEISKGDALEVARVAAVQAAKETSRIIPYCHPLPIDSVKVEFSLEEAGVRVSTSVTATARTGVEMEALTAASVAALALYDMLKMYDDGLAIESVRLLEKRGGKSDHQERFTAPPRAAVLVLSDRSAAGEREDLSGTLLVSSLEAAGFKVEDYRVLPDEPERAAAVLKAHADEKGLDLVLTTGGTGLGPRDRTPEAMEGVLEREAPGIAEALRAFGVEHTPYAMLSRGRAGLRGRTLIVNVPGSPSAAAESLELILPALVHAVAIMRGGEHSDTGAGPKRVGR